MKYIKYYSPVTKEIKVIEVCLKFKKNQKPITEEDWFKKMICGEMIGSPTDNVNDLVDFYVIEDESGARTFWKNVFMESCKENLKVYGCIWASKKEPISKPICLLTKKGWKLL